MFSSLHFPGWKEGLKPTRHVHVWFKNYILYIVYDDTYFKTFHSSYLYALFRGSFPFFFIARWRSKMGRRPAPLCPAGRQYGTRTVLVRYCTVSVQMWYCTGSAAGVILAQLTRGLGTAICPLIEPLPCLCAIYIHFVPPH